MATTSSGRGTAQASQRSRQQTQSSGAAGQTAAGSRSTRRSGTNSPATGSSSPRSSASARGSSGGRGARSEGATVHLPFVTAQFHGANVHLPSGKDVASAAEDVRAQLPSREQTLFYGGLAAGAVFSVIEWPVALAIGIGAALAQRATGQQQDQSSS